jgi:hypothetical protein
MRHAVTALILLVATLQPAAAEPVTGAPASIPAPDGTKLAATYYSGDKPVLLPPVQQGPVFQTVSQNSSPAPVGMSSW